MGGNSLVTIKIMGNNSLKKMVAVHQEPRKIFILEKREASHRKLYNVHLFTKSSIIVFLVPEMMDCIFFYFGFFFPLLYCFTLTDTEMAKNRSK
jgi:hypothetical protein